MTTPNEPAYDWQQGCQPKMKSKNMMPKGNSGIAAKRKANDRTRKVR